MADIFQEVDDDIRRERYTKLWKTYGPYVIGAAVVFVLAVGAYTGWRQYRQSQLGASGAAFATALNEAENGDDTAAAGAFATLAADGAGGYPVLARLQEAEARSGTGDIEGAATIYRSVAADTGVDTIFRDLAVLLLAMRTLDSADAATLSAQLQPLTADTNAWRFSARELTALLALREGETEQARDMLTKLSDDATAPVGVRGRAAELLASLNG
jgi:hypothetical protein